MKKLKNIEGRKLLYRQITMNNANMAEPSDVCVYE